jgi:hypothetical protein
MATHRISIMGTLNPDTTGDVWPEPYSVKATNDLFDHMVMIFTDDGSNKNGAFGLFNVPQNYVGTPKIIPVWTSTLTTGNVVWDFDYRAVGGDDAESLDQASYQESVTVTDAAPSAAHERNTPEMALTGSNLAAGDTVAFKISLDGAAILHDLVFEYADA